MRRSEVRPLSVRRPLRDVANNIGGGRFSKSVGDATAKKDKEVIHRPKPRVSSPDHQNDDDAFDRLLLLQSDLSALVRQVDELVVQAFQLNSTSKQGRKEVESFSHVLSEMVSSLKPWIPRFQRAISSCASEPENQIQTLSVSESVSVVNEVEPESLESPDKPSPDMLISPSPLVSWRANCTTAGGPQLFLLTPLPISKGLSTKRQDPPKSVYERVTSDASNKLFSLNSVTIDTKCSLVQAKPSDLVVTESSTPMMFSKSNRSIVIMTPCFKRSPPKSCVLLEEILESTHRSHAAVRKSTPFPIGLKCSDLDISESSSGSEASDDIALKYPELLGIQQARKSVVMKKKIEESPDWFRSPPKSCVLLDPSNEQTLGNNNGKGIGLKEPLDELVERTPLRKESQRGKRPGENTLKKELWTKFEAASSRELRFNVPILSEASQKGFLDRLDEVSCDGEI